MYGSGTHGVQVRVSDRAKPVPGLLGWGWLSGTLGREVGKSETSPVNTRTIPKEIGRRQLLERAHLNCPDTTFLPTLSGHAFGHDHL